jgi:hypothetical protein
MNYIICFWDKSKIQITEEMANLLKEAIKNESIKSFTIEDSLYAVGGVEKIIPKDEAYRVFPEQNEIFQRMELKIPSALKLSNNQKSLN